MDATKRQRDFAMDQLRKAENWLPDGQAGYIGKVIKHDKLSMEDASLLIRSLMAIDTMYRDKFAQEISQGEKTIYLLLKKYEHPNS